MGLFSKRTSIVSKCKFSGSLPCRQAAPPAFERLEGRQLYSAAGIAAINAEYAYTSTEVDAFGTNVQAILGSATSGESADPLIAGAEVQHFHNNGAIYWSPATGAHLVFGDIGAEYAKLATETDAHGINVQRLVGLPTSDEMNLSGFAGGRTNTFQWGVIDWSTTTGAHVLYGSIRDEYNHLTAETDPYGTSVQKILGLPTSDEANITGVAGGRTVGFQGGSIDWSAATGAHVVYGDPGYVYGTLGGPAGWMGLPTTDESGSLNNRIVDYQYGYITWSPATQAVVHQTGVTVTTRYGSELVVNDVGGRDIVSISQSGSVLIIRADGQVVAYAPVPTAGLFVYTRGGADTVTVIGTMTATVEAVDGAVTNIYVSNPNDIVWCDSTDHVYGAAPAANIHQVGSFWHGVSKATGASLADPTDTGKNTFKPTGMSLFGTGPVYSDVNQGNLGDCYFLATLAGVAQQQPNAIKNEAVDMGDGTYTVVYYDNGTPVFVRVNGDVVGSNGSYAYARPGPNNTLWAPIMEKAFAEYRDWDRSYAHAAGGNPDEVLQDMKFGYNDVSAFQLYLTSSTDLFNRFSGDLANHRPVMLCTRDDTVKGTQLSPGGLVSEHCYTLLGVERLNGQNEFVVRNPWGIRPYKSTLENAQGIATMTYNQLMNNFTSFTELA